MGIVHFGAPLPLLTRIHDEFKPWAFIETGTFRAETAIWAASRFEQVWTVELSEQLYEENRLLLDPYRNITALQGDSRQVLARLAGEVHEAAVFWLDAHWCGGSTAGIDDQCPLLEELDAIATRPYGDFVLIDDARLFLSRESAPSQWPSIFEIGKRLERFSDPKYIAIVDDVIVAVPEKSARNFLVDFCRVRNAEIWEEYRAREGESRLKIAGRTEKIPTLRQIRIDRRKKESCWLLDFSHDVTSQTGEDGVIEKIFEIIEPTNRWCIEFGAWDGKKFSNTYNLIQNKQWNGLLIEGNPSKYQELAQTYAGVECAHCVSGLVALESGSNSLDAYLEKNGLPIEPDLLSIDIDGNDYHVWSSLQQFRPQVVICEFNPTIPNDVLFVQAPDLEINQACSLRALIELAKQKGYELVAAMPWNGIFVVKEAFAKFGIIDNSIDAMYMPTNDGRLFQGFDGTLFNVGLEELEWAGKGISLAYDELQVMPQENRRFPDAIPKNVIATKTNVGLRKYHGEQGMRLPEAPNFSTITRERLRECVGKSDPTILEIGANDGMHTLWFLELFDNPRIYCFEPDPRAIERFRKKVGRHPNVTLFEMALSDYNGEAIFYQSNSQYGWDQSGSIRKPKEHLTVFP
uniref:Methyltransferase, FkbM family n=1 Tax=Candidatus Kentrum sp. LPFa TaxID=2126335 RepID=A0A450W3R4_9GAMM|nr:MAG: methyltransferase, FkbM family [Candidatus Kentron sp. LPFa]